MKRVLLIILGIYIASFATAQVFTLDNYYMIIGKRIIKAPLEVKVDAINEYLSTIKVPVDVIEQKIEGHVFVNVYVTSKKVTHTTLMYGINKYVDRTLIESFMDVNTSWLGSDLNDSTARVVVGIKIDFRFCSLENIEKCNLYAFEKNEDDSLLTGLKHNIAVYNTFKTLYHFDSSSVRGYNSKLSPEKQKKIKDQLSSLRWWKKEFNQRLIYLDYDEDKSMNIIVQTDDSVHIVENNTLLLSEAGQLKAIKRTNDISILQVENTCKLCSKTNTTTTLFVHREGQPEESLAFVGFSTNPKLNPDSINIRKTISFTQRITYLRTSPFKLNEPYNRCTGVISEFETCMLPRTWGNIFAEIDKGNRALVIHEYTDSFKKKWYYIVIQRTDGCFMGWVSEDDVISI